MLKFKHSSYITKKKLVIHVPFILLDVFNDELMQLIEVRPRDCEPKTELDDSIQFHKVPVVFVSKLVLEDIWPYVE